MLYPSSTSLYGCSVLVRKLRDHLFPRTFLRPGISSTSLFPSSHGFSVIYFILSVYLLRRVSARLEVSLGKADTSVSPLWVLVRDCEYLSSGPVRVSLSPGPVRVSLFLAGIGARATASVSIVGDGTSISPP